MVKQLSAFMMSFFLAAFAYCASEPLTGKIELESLPKVGITQLDRKIANNFLRLYRLSRKGILNKTLHKQLKKDIYRNDTFKDYRVWADGTYQLVQINNLGKLKKACVEYKNKNFTNSIKKFFNEKVSAICFKKYLSEIGKLLSQKEAFHKLQTKYFKQNITRIIQERDELERLLASFKRNPEIHQLYSKTIIYHYMLHDISPPLSLIKELSITPEFTRFLQTKDLDVKGSQYTFIKQLIKLKNTAEKVLDDKKSEKIKTEKLTTLLDYYNQTYDFQPKDRASLNMISLGKDYTRATDYTRARKVFSLVLNKKGHEHKDQAIFELVWTYILESDYKGAYKYVIKEFVSDPKEYSHDSQLSFWIAQVFENIGKKEDGNEILHKIIKENPLSYYAILAAKKLSKNSPLLANNIYLKNLDGKKRDVASSAPLDQSWLRRISLWGDLGSYYFLKKEIEIKENSKNFERYIINAAYLLSKEENYLESFKVIIRSLNRKEIAFDQNILRILFPTPYFHQIKQQTKNDFDPVIALSLIRQESGFNRKARSRVGARGLMQLMPATARRFKRRLKTRHLYNPTTNISIGTKYFNKLMSRYDNNLVYSLAAYNAGEHRVDRWQNDFLSNESILKNIENIPYRETRKYVKLIFRNIFFYKLLMGNDGNDNQKFNQIFDLHLGFNR